MPDVAEMAEKPSVLIIGGLGIYPTSCAHIPGQIFNNHG